MNLEQIIEGRWPVRTGKFQMNYVNWIHSARKHIKKDEIGRQLDDIPDPNLVVIKQLSREFGKPSKTLFTYEWKGKADGQTIQILFYPGQPLDTMAEPDAPERHLFVNAWPELKRGYKRK